MQQESTNSSISFTNSILIRIYESQKVEIASIETQQQDISIMPPYVVEVKEKETHEQATDQSVTLENKGDLNQASFSMPTISI